MYSNKTNNLWLFFYIQKDLMQMVIKHNKQFNLIYKKLNILLNSFIKSDCFRLNYNNMRNVFLA